MNLTSGEYNCRSRSYEPSANEKKRKFLRKLCIPLIPLVRGRVRELGRRKADLAVCDVEDVVESLEECHAVDKIEAGAARHPKVAHDEIHEVRRAANGRVELIRTEAVRRGSPTKVGVHIPHEGRFGRWE